jgi:hypothetical protein
MAGVAPKRANIWSYELGETVAIILNRCSLKCSGYLQHIAIDPVNVISTGRGIRGSPADRARVCSTPVSPPTADEAIICGKLATSFGLRQPMLDNAMTDFG